MSTTVNLRFSALLITMIACLAGQRHQVFAQNVEIAENLSRKWIRQAQSREDFSYPPLMWHQVRGAEGQWGWVKSNLIYERRGSETRKAVFIVHEKLSETEAVVDVMVTFSKPGWRPTRGNPGRPSQTTRTRKQFLFSGFDFGKTKEKQQLSYTGGVLFDGEHSVNLRDGTEVILLRLEPFEIPPLPKHAAELGVGSRTWTDDTGRFSVEASFRRLRDDKVTLVTKDDRRIDVPLDRLAVADQKMVVLLNEAGQRNRQRAPSISPPGILRLKRRKPSSFEQGLRARIHADVMRSFGRW